MMVHMMLINSVTLLHYYLDSISLHNNIFNFCTTIVDLGHEPPWDRILMRNQDSNGNVIVVCINDNTTLSVAFTSETMFALLISIMGPTVTATEVTHVSKA